MDKKDLAKSIEPFLILNFLDYLIYYSLIDFFCRYFSLTEINALTTSEGLYITFSQWAIIFFYRHKVKMKISNGSEGESKIGVNYKWKA